MLKRTQRTATMPRLRSFKAGAFRTDRKGRGVDRPVCELAKPTDGESFGYVIADPTTDALIDRTHQRRGIGWKTLDLLAHHFGAQGCEQL